MGNGKTRKKKIVTKAQGKKAEVKKAAKPPIRVPEESKDPSVQILRLEREVLAEARKLTKREVTSCYEMTMLVRQIMEIERNIDPNL